MNGPIVGTDVFAPLDEVIIGGREGIGKGWRMLMESLAAGRSISLPALSVGAAQMATRICGAYATVREQFDTPIGRFEGIEEPLARIAGLTYLMTRDAHADLRRARRRREARRAPATSARPTSPTACARSSATRWTSAPAAAIQRGPRNTLARAWDAVPIGITVEGANILTRSMIIYGQGAIRCHPFVQQARSTRSPTNDLAAFDKAIFGHVNLFMTRATRTKLLAWTGSRLAGAPARAGHDALLPASVALLRRVLDRVRHRDGHARRLAQAARENVGPPRRRARVSLSRQRALKRYHDEPKTASNFALVRWSVELCLYRVQEALRRRARQPAGALDRVSC